MKKKRSSGPGSTPAPGQKSLVTATNAAAEPAASGVAGAGFPVVGIGASAGGLEALGRFFAAVPKDCGLAFVVVQHLDPDHKAMLVDLLRGSSALPVLEITDQLPLRPGHVHVIPPNCDLAIFHGVLQLLEPAAPRGLRLPIDCFFRALADDCGERGVAVILSGMGSDGALGVRAVKEKGGGLFVQSLESAKFDGMPRSAVATGLADGVAPAGELPGLIAGYLEHFPTPPATDEADPSAGGLEKVILHLRTQTGHDFSRYKNSTIKRRIERRMGLHQLKRVADYARFVRETPQEGRLLFKELLIGVTRFFRDPEVWEQLGDELIPELCAGRPEGGQLRAWTPACSTGEEAYSLAIVFRETLDRLQLPGKLTLQIFATDLDQDAIEKARTGRYPANIAADVSEPRLQRFFVATDHGFELRKEIREMVVFAPQNLIMDPPFTKLDFVTCRNLLIYFSSELQRTVLSLFHYSLNPGGVLLLGTAETIGTGRDLFAAVPGKNRLFRRGAAEQRLDAVEFPPVFSGPRPPAGKDGEADSGAASVQNLEGLADRVLLQAHAPPAVLVTGAGDIVYTSGNTGQYLEPPAGRANWNLMAMARAELAGPICEGFHRARRQPEAVELTNLDFDNDGRRQLVHVNLRQLAAPAPLRGMVLVVFTAVTAQPDGPAKARRGKGPDPAADEARVLALTNSLQSAREELQSTREEMQTSHEELKSTNEELQSTNEELQSTNEELTTSKEELQSLNEELQTVNQEQQARVDDLSRISNDMENLLNSTDIATLFLDDKLNIRRFTDRTVKLINLIPGDIGRPVTDLATGLNYPELAADAREVLRLLVVVEKEIRATDKSWYLVRIMPYQTYDKRNDGLVITFANITDSKTLEAKLREAQAALEARFEDQSGQLDSAHRHLDDERSKTQ